MENKRIFSISGMHCAGCAAAVERAVKKFAVKDVYVNFASGRLSFISDGNTPSDEEVILAVKKAGFKAQLPPTAMHAEKAPEWKKDFFIFLGALFPTVAILIICFAHIPASPVFNAVCQLFLMIPVLIAGNGFFRRGIPALLRGFPNMDSLISCSASAGIIYSIILLFRDPNAHLYFDASAMIISLIMFGKMLEARSRHTVSSAIRKLIELTPRQAHLVCNGQTRDIPSDELQKDDIIRILPGEKIPADGIILDGNAFINESMLTGEELPVAKKSGDKLFGGTLNIDGIILLKISSTGSEAVLGQIVQLISQAQNSRPPVAALADKVSGFFVWIIFALAGLTAITWSFCGTSADVINFTLSVMVVACPCALGLATPVALIAGIGRGARSGILIKNGSALEHAAKLRTVVFDKTGTITSGQPQVKQIIPASQFSREQLLTAAAAIEKFSSHPLANAITAEAEKSRIYPPNENIQNFTIIPGRGVKATYNNQLWLFGNAGFMRENTIQLPECNNKTVNRSFTHIFCAVDGRFAGTFFIGDSIRPEAESAISMLHKMNIKCFMLTGDNQSAAANVAEKLKLDSFSTDLLPHEKVEAVKKIRSFSSFPVAMIGDGINDAPVLAASDLGIAISSGSDIAIESADVVLLNNNLLSIVQLIKLSRATFRVIRQNLFWAFFYNICAIPLAAGVTAAIWNIKFSPPLCAAMMAASSLSVVLNSLLLFTGKEVKQEKRNSMLPFLKKKAGKENIHLFHGKRTKTRKA